MVFQCQRESFLKEFTTTIESVKKADDGSVEVTFKDTVFFPEGGGQPFDEGIFIKSSDKSEYQVKNVIRRGPIAVHILADENNPLSNLKENDEVLQKINWNRRFDHMQQHSGQHLITALFEREFNNPTKAWWLGSESCYIEVTTEVKQSELQHIEKLCNECISQALPVEVQIYEKPEDAGDEVTRASRGLPLDLSGPIRVIKIEGVDANMCCGTHVKDLAQLQVVKLMGTEKTKGKIMVHFLVGNRVIKKLEETYQREQELTLLLNGGPETHKDLIKKLQSTVKSSQKTIQKLTKELATNLATKLNEDPNPPQYFFHHRNDGSDMEFATIFFKAVKPKIFYFMTIADGIDSKNGSAILHGDPTDIDAVKDEIAKILDGKGNGKNGKYQAKVTKLNKIKDCENFVKKYFENK
ncbi:hypothetical protein PVAND_016599 [Polypedilum vanderplanki]|uniref:Alanyl-transfer RNA synthetases family profile domain-containing protein n=1 Tax=Polypedilum vanderplanki TaxID=319348 RepID=A0A9J6BGN0_POLVA|nr:hypothetical protein PVAND_016599 [Polypedilum vanderplanki]